MIFSGEDIRVLRQKAGFSQEKLADMAKINLRTLQRIESGSTTPRASTIALICEALEIAPEEISKIEGEKPRTKDGILFLYLSVLSVLVVPFGNILFPWIIHRHFKAKAIDITSYYIRVVNDQILWTLLLFLMFTLLAFQIISSISDILLVATIVLAFLLVLFNITYTIRSIIKSSKGKTGPYFFNLIQFVKE